MIRIECQCRTCKTEATKRGQSVMAALIPETWGHVANDRDGIHGLVHIANDKSANSKLVRSRIGVVSA